MRIHATLIAATLMLLAFARAESPALEVTVLQGNTYQLDIGEIADPADRRLIDSDAITVDLINATQIGAPVETIADGTYIIHNTGSDSYWTGWIKSSVGTDPELEFMWLDEEVFENAAKYGIARNDDGTWSVGADGHYISTVIGELSADGDGMVHSVALTDEPAESRFNITPVIAGGETPRFKFSPAGHDDLFLCSWQGHTRNLFLQCDGDAVDGCQMELLPYINGAALEISVFRPDGDRNICPDDRVITIHTSADIKVPVQGSLLFPVESGIADPEIPEAFEPYVRVTCEDEGLRFSNTDLPVPEELVQGTIAIGEREYSIEIGVNENDAIAIGGSAVFTRDDGDPFVCLPENGFAEIADERHSFAGRVTDIEDLVDDVRYMIAAAHSGCIAGAETSVWQDDGHEVTGFLFAEEEPVYEDTIDISVSSAERFRLQKTDYRRFAIQSLSSGAYLKAAEDRLLTLADSPEQAGDFLCKPSDSETVTDAFYMEHSGKYLSTIRESEAAGLSAYYRSGASDLWFYRVYDSSVTVTGVSAGTAYLTIGGSTIAIEVSAPRATAGEMPYPTVQKAVDSGTGTVVIDDASAAEDVLAPVDTAVTYRRETFGTPAYATKASSRPIEVQFVNGEPYLFLPAEADLNHLKLTGVPKKARLAGIPDEAEAGVTYPVCVTWDVSPTLTVRKEFTIIGCANIASLYLNDIGVTLDFLHRDKANAAVTGTMVKVSAEGRVECAEKISKFNGRGNTSWVMNYARNRNSHKRSYALKLDSKTQLIRDGAKAKRWVLESNNFDDNSGVNNFTAYNIYKMIDGDCPVDIEPVTLYVDGEFRGYYFIIDKVESGSHRVPIGKTVYDEEDKTQTARVICEDYDDHFSTEHDQSTAWMMARNDDPEVIGVKGDSEDPAINAGVLAYSYAKDSKTTKDGGYLIEVAWQYYDNECWFITGRGVQISVKEPEYGSREQIQKIAMFVQDFEDALYSPTGVNAKGHRWTDYMDIPSLAKEYIMSCFMKENDFFDNSNFFYVDTENGELRALMHGGPAWDFDSPDFYKPGLYQKKDWQGYNGHMLYIEQFLKYGDFVSELYRLTRGPLAEAQEIIAAETIPDYTERVTPALCQDDLMWDWEMDLLRRVENDAKEITELQYAAWDEIWSDETGALRGVTISDSDGTLIAEAVGADSFQWCRIDPGDPEKLIPIDAATADIFTPNEPGMYCVVCAGTPISGTEADRMISNIIDWA